MINNQQQTFLSVRSTTYITRSDAEMADMSNPNGDIYATDYYVEAQTGAEAFRHDRNFADREGAEILAFHVQGALDNGRALDPAHWAFSRIPYGCDGWEEQELAHEVREARDAGELHPLDR